MKSRLPILAILLLALSCACWPQEQQVKWRQVQIGTYSVTWPAAQGENGTCLVNNGSGALEWQICQTVGHQLDRIRLGDGSSSEPALSFTNDPTIGLFRNSVDGYMSMKSTYLGNQSFVDFYGLNGLDGGIRIRRGEDGYSAGNSNWVRSTANDGTTLVDLKLKANKVTISLASAEYSLPTTAGTNLQCLITDGNGGTSWGACATGAGSHPDPVRLTDGTSAAPTYSFTSETASGIYRVSSGKIAMKASSSQISVAHNSTSAQLNITNPSTTATYVNVLRSEISSGASTIPLYMDTTQLRAGTDGTSAVPFYSFTNDAAAGLSRGSDAAMVLNSNSGWGQLRLLVTANNAIEATLQSNGTWVPKFSFKNNMGSTPTLSQGYIYATQLWVGDGSTTLPMYSFVNGTTMGLWLDAANSIPYLQGRSNYGRLGVQIPGNDGINLRLESAGDWPATIAAIKTYTGTAVYANLKLMSAQNQIIDGTITVPSLSFISDTNVGMYRISNDVLGLVANSAVLKLTNVSSRSQINLAGNYTATAGTNYNVIRSEDNAATLQDTYFDSNQVLVTDGTSSEPAYSFLNDKLMGIYRAASNTMAFRLGTGANMRLTDGGSYTARMNLYAFNTTPGGTSYNILGSYDSSGTPVQQGLWLDTNLVDIRAAAGVLKINGTQVVAPRQAAVADVGGTADTTYSSNEVTLINDLKAQLNALLARLRTHGLIAP